MPTFAGAAAEVARARRLIPKVDGVPVRHRDAAWGGQTDRTTWIDYRGPWRNDSQRSRRSMSSRAACAAGDVPQQGGGDRPRCQGQFDDVLQPALQARRRCPALEVQANAIDTMLRGEPLRDVPPLVEHPGDRRCSGFAPVAAALSNGPVRATRPP